MSATKTHQICVHNQNAPNLCPQPKRTKLRKVVSNPGSVPVRTAYLAYHAPLAPPPQLIQLHAHLKRKFHSWNCSSVSTRSATHSVRYPACAASSYKKHRQTKSEQTTSPQAPSVGTRGDSMCWCFATCSQQTSTLTLVCTSCDTCTTSFPWFAAMVETCSSSCPPPACDLPASCLQPACHPPGVTSLHQQSSAQASPGP